MIDASNRATSIERHFGGVLNLAGSLELLANASCSEAMGASIQE